MRQLSAGGIPGHPENFGSVEARWRVTHGISKQNRASLVNTGGLQHQSSNADIVDPNQTLDLGVSESTPTPCVTVGVLAARDCNRQPLAYRSPGLLL